MVISWYYCTFQVPYCKIKNIFQFLVFVFVYYLCEKYYKSIAVQYYITNCVSWVPRLTKFVGLNEQTGSYKFTLGMELDHT